MALIKVNISVNDYSYLIVILPIALTMAYLLKKATLKTNVKHNVILNFILTMLFFPAGFAHLFGVFIHQ
tara:strand:- start:1465 stop:1671 length:207 start_codon:yes stop_codon:yes gene_type:complete